MILTVVKNAVWPMGLFALLNLTVGAHSELLYPLPGPSGCPHIHSWERTLPPELQGVIDAVDEGFWRKGGTVIEGESLLTYAKINDEWQWGVCSHSSSSPPCLLDKATPLNANNVATCVYAANYCPKLYVIYTESNAADCVGQYTQVEDNMWRHDDNNDLALTVVGVASEDILNFACKKNGITLGYVKKYDCQNALLDKPLHYGYNLLPNRPPLYIAGGPLITDGPFFKAFQITSLEDSSQWFDVWVVSPWGISSQVKKQSTGEITFNLKANIITTLHYTNPQPLYVELNNVKRHTFSVRLLQPDTCSSGQREERINFLVMDTGKHYGSNGQLAVAHEANLAKFLEDSSLTQYFDEAKFNTSPNCYMQVVDKDNPESYYHPRMFLRTTTHFQAYAITETDEPPVGSVGTSVICIQSRGHYNGLFGDYRHYTYGEGLAEHDLDYSPLTHDIHNEANLSGNPIAFVGAMSAGGSHLGPVRLHLATLNQATFSFVPNTCIDEPRGIYHHPETWGILVIAAPTTTTTTTTTTTATTSTATSTTQMAVANKSSPAHLCNHWLTLVLFALSGIGQVN